MNIIKWTAGFIFIAAFVYYNIFVYEGILLFKLINFLLFSSLFILFRVIFGPTSADRIVAVDILGLLSIGILTLTALFYQQSFFIDIGLIWALLSFIASISYSKILEGRKLDD